MIIQPSIWCCRNRIKRAALLLQLELFYHSPRSLHDKSIGHQTAIRRRSQKPELHQAGPKRVRGDHSLETRNCALFHLNTLAQRTLRKSRYHSFGRIKGQAQIPLHPAEPRAPSANPPPEGDGNWRGGARDAISKLQ